MNEKPHKRRYVSKGCSRCQGYGVVIVYEQSFVAHNAFAQTVGAMHAVNNSQTSMDLLARSNGLLVRAVTLACPSCRNLQEAPTL